MRVRICNKRNECCEQNFWKSDCDKTHQDTENISSFFRGVASGNADLPTPRALTEVAEADIVRVTGADRPAMICNYSASGQMIR